MNNALISAGFVNETTVQLKKVHKRSRTVVMVDTDDNRIGADSNLTGATGWWDHSRINPGETQSFRWSFLKMLYS
jgi:hypothetical protein